MAYSAATALHQWAVSAVEPEIRNERQSRVRSVARLISNLAKQPEERKFRRIRVSNDKVTALLAADGTRDLLGAAGFTAKTYDGEEVLEVTDSQSIGPKAAATSAVLAAASNALHYFPLHQPLPVHLLRVTSVAFLPDGRLVTGSEDNAVRVFAEGIAEPISVLLGHVGLRGGTAGVRCLTCSVEGLLVSGGDDGQIIVWDLEKKRPSQILRGHGKSSDIPREAAINSLAFNPQGSELISGGGDRTCRIWEPRSGSELAVLLVGLEAMDSDDADDASVNAVAFYGKEGVLTASSDGAVRLWLKGRCVGTYKDRNSTKVNGLVVLPPRDGAATGAFISINANGMLVTRGANRTLLDKVVAHTKAGFVVKCVPATGDVVTSGEDHIKGPLCKVWSTANDNIPVLHQIIQNYDKVLSIAVHTITSDLIFSSARVPIVFTRDPVRANMVGQNVGVPSHDPVVTEPMHRDSSAGDKSLEDSQSPGWQHSIPIQLFKRTYLVQWNPGDTPGEVTRRFLDSVEMDDTTRQSYKNDPGLTAFIAEGMLGREHELSATESIGTSSSLHSTPSDEAQEALVAEMCNLGFESKRARSALIASSWSIQRAASMLLEE